VGKWANTQKRIERHKSVPNKDEILKTEYSVPFDVIRQDRMVVSFYKYGPLAVNYSNKLIDAVASLEKRLQMYKDTGNTEFLADVANFAMIEYMLPQHPNAHFAVLDDGKSHIVGQGVNQINADHK
jgi:hypothetical protein